MVEQKLRMENIIDIHYSKGAVEAIVTYEPLTRAARFFTTRAPTNPTSLYRITGVPYGSDLSVAFYPYEVGKDVVDVPRSED